MENIAQLKQDFKENGFVLIKNFFSKEEIQQLIGNIQEAAGQIEKPDVLNVGNLKFHHLIMHRSERLRQFISQPKIIDFLKNFMGSNIWVRWDQAVEKAPGAGTFPWHTDNSYSRLKDPHFQFWISLTKMTKENGGIWLMPGTHKKKIPHGRSGPHTVALIEGREEHFVSAEIGDAVLFSSRLLHSTTPNVTQDSRWAYVVEYMKEGHIDPFIDPPYLMIAKDGQPAVSYVDELPGENSLLNKIKYFKANYKGLTYKGKQKAKKKLAA